MQGGPNSFDALGGEFTPQVNLEVMQQYIQRKVRLVGELMTVDDNVAVVKASDGSQVNIQLTSGALPPAHCRPTECSTPPPSLARPCFHSRQSLARTARCAIIRCMWPNAACSFDTKYIEFVGLVANPNTVKEEEHWEFGNEFGAPPLCSMTMPFTGPCLRLADNDDHTSG